MRLVGGKPVIYLLAPEFSKLRRTCHSLPSGLSQPPIVLYPLNALRIDRLGKLHGGLKYIRMESCPRCPLSWRPPISFRELRSREPFTIGMLTIFYSTNSLPPSSLPATPRLGTIVEPVIDPTNAVIDDQTLICVEKVTPGLHTEARSSFITQVLLPFSALDFFKHPRI